MRLFSSLMHINVAWQVRCPKLRPFLKYQSAYVLT